MNFIKPTTLTFMDKVHIVGDTYSYNFKPDKPISWRAGQHGLVEVTLPTGRTSRRMFSISSSPTEPTITITTFWLGDKASEYKKTLWNLLPGDTVRLRGPVGPMFIREDAKHNVLIAGGIGITPFHSILTNATQHNPKLSVTLLYANNNAMSIPFKTELDSLTTRMTRLSIKYVQAPIK